MKNKTKKTPQEEKKHAKKKKKRITLKIKKEKGTGKVADLSPSKGQNTR